jgi:hypothetical protein
VVIIGQKLNKYSDFYDYVLTRSNELKIELIINKDEVDVADLLSDVKVTYLPYPDGISIRRGTLFASINNSCVVVSKLSPDSKTNDLFNEYCYLINSNCQATDLITQILKGSITLKNSSKFKYMYSWEALLKRHKNLYNSL